MFKVSENYNMKMQVYVTCILCYVTCLVRNNVHKLYAYQNKFLDAHQKVIWFFFPQQMLWFDNLLNWLTGPISNALKVLQTLEQMSTFKMILNSYLLKAHVVFTNFCHCLQTQDNLMKFSLCVSLVCVSSATLRHNLFTLEKKKKRASDFSACRNLYEKK